MDQENPEAAYSHGSTVTSFQSFWFSSHFPPPAFERHERGGRDSLHGPTGTGKGRHARARHQQQLGRSGRSGHELNSDGLKNLLTMASTEHSNGPKLVRSGSKARVKRKELRSTNATSTTWDQRSPMERDVGLRCHRRRQDR